MYHETPSEQIFNEMKDVAISIWKNNYSDEFGYVTEKVNRINSISNYADNAMVFFRMFDWQNQMIMTGMLSDEAVVYIKQNN